jgi:hypothetical protein
LNKASEAAESVRKDHDAILDKIAPFEKLAKELALIAFSDIQNYMTVAEGGEVQAIPLDSIKGKKSRAIKRIKEKTTIAESKDGETIYKNSQIEYELYDKPTALWRLIELRGDKPAEKQEISGLNGGPIEFSRLDRANRIAAIAELARSRKKAEK